MKNLFPCASFLQMGLLAKTAVALAKNQSMIRLLMQNHGWQHLSYALDVTFRIEEHNNGQFFFSFSSDGKKMENHICIMKFGNEI